MVGALERIQAVIADVWVGMFSLLVSLFAGLRHGLKSGGRFAWLFPNSKICEIICIFAGIHDLKHSVASLAVVCHAPPHFAVTETTWRVW